MKYNNYYLNLLDEAGILDQLQDAFTHFSVDPNSKQYAKVNKILDGLNNDILIALSQADIEIISALAKSRLILNT